jgi:hypothetical protein
MGYTDWEWGWDDAEKKKKTMYKKEEVGMES